MLNGISNVTNIALDWINNKLNEEHKKVLHELKALDIDSIYAQLIDPLKYDSSVEKIFLEYPFE